jgi:hypothetical protein
MEMIWMAGAPVHFFAEAPGPRQPKQLRRMKASQNNSGSQYLAGVCSGSFGFTEARAFRLLPGHPHGAICDSRGNGTMKMTLP